MRSTHPVFAAAMMLIAGIVRPAKARAYSDKPIDSVTHRGRKKSNSEWLSHGRRVGRNFGTGRYIRLNTPHPPTTAELSKARSMERKWRKAAAMYPGSPAAIALQSDVAAAVARALTQFGSPA